MCFFFNDTATPEISTLSLHDALPISREQVLEEGPGQADGDDEAGPGGRPAGEIAIGVRPARRGDQPPDEGPGARSEEHTSELQSRQYLVCRLLLEKNKKHRVVLSTFI